MRIMSRDSAKPSHKTDESLELLKKAILKLEAKRKSKIFCFIEGPEDHICYSTVTRIYEQRKEFNNLKTLEVLIHSNGGHGDVAYQLATFFRRHCETLNVIVPFYAKSAATLMCLAANNIFMSEFAELGPIDVQVQDPLERGARPFSPLDEFKSLEFLREYAVESLDYFTGLLLERSGMSIKEAIHEAIPCVTAMMRPMYEKVDPIKFGEHRRMLSEGWEYARRLLRMSGNPDPEGVAEKLVENYPSHAFFVDYQEAKDALGLPMRKLETADFELLQPMLYLSPERDFYGFIKNDKPKAAKAKKTKARTSRKGPAPIAGVIPKATA
jgi:hypothetical protein